MSTLNQYQLDMERFLLETYSDTPSLIVHLYPKQQHLRFEGQDSVFNFKSPVGSVLIRALRNRTIPHELLPLFVAEDVPFYNGCLVVRISCPRTADAEQTSQPTTGGNKVVPGSIHNSSPYNVPSPYVRYPQENLLLAGGTSKSKGSPMKDKSSEQKDKEAMPAPSAPSEPQKSKGSSALSTIVLHPTAQSIQADLALMAMEFQGVLNGVQDSVPPVPGAIAPTPTANSMPPPAKKQKRELAVPDASSIYAVEGQILLAQLPQLDLEPARNVVEKIDKLAAHAHPAHVEAPPRPKTRKRTVAEVEADEAQQAERERFMLTCDERLSSRVSGAQGAATGSDGDGQGGAAWEPRYDNFQVIAELKQKAKEKAEREARENEEKAKKMEQDRAKAAEILQQQAEKRATEEGRQRQEDEIRARQKHIHDLQLKRAAAQQQAQLQAQQQAQEQSQTQAQLQAQVRAQAQAHAQAQQKNNLNHGIPMQNGGMPNILPNGMPMPATMAGPVQARFHQVTQAQASSPIIRQNSPQNMSSPMVGNVAMQHSTSSMGGSPPRPSSVVQNHQPMSVPMTASMSARGSQQSHQAGTPRMPTATPNMAHSTPISRAQVMQTPRMTQGSPPPGMMTPGQQLGQAHLMMNAQGMNPQMQSQQQFIAAQMAQQQRALQHQQQQNLVQALQQGFQPGQSMTPQQLAQQQRLMQQQQALMQQRGLAAQTLTPQQYAQLQAMQNNAQLQQLQSGQMQNPVQRQMAMNGQGMVNMNPANNPHAQAAMLRQIEQINRQQALQIQQQQQQQAQQQAQQQQQQQQQHVQQQMGQQPQMQPGVSQAIQAQIKNQQIKLYQSNIHMLIAQHGSIEAIPPQVHEAFKSKCFVNARAHVLQQFNQQNRAAQFTMMQQQQQRQQQAQAQAQGMQGMMQQDGM